jgi:hypothetical protein
MSFTKEELECLVEVLSREYGKLPEGLVKRFKELLDKENK